MTLRNIAFLVNDSVKHTQYEIVSQQPLSQDPTNHWRGIVLKIGNHNWTQFMFYFCFDCLQLLKKKHKTKQVLTKIQISFSKQNTFCFIFTWRDVLYFFLQWLNGTLLLNWKSKIPKVGRMLEKDLASELYFYLFSSRILCKSWNC